MMKEFCQILLIFMMIFFLYFIDSIDYIDLFSTMNQICTPEINLIWSWCIIFYALFCILCIIKINLLICLGFASIFLRENNLLFLSLLKMFCFIGFGIKIILYI